MFLIQRPTEAHIRRFLDSQRQQPFTYPNAGIMELPPPGYAADRNRIRLGEGKEVFRSAVQALERWEMFNIGWVELCWPAAQIRTGSCVAVLAHHLGFWSLNACRIISVIDEDGESRRYGFTYATLPDHAERGQERFTVEWRPDDSVWYDILAYSRPKHVLAKLGYPITRSLQKRFARDSLDAMVRGSASCC